MIRAKLTNNGLRQALAKSTSRSNAPGVCLINMTSLTCRPPDQSLVPSFLQRIASRLNAALVFSLLAHTLLLSIMLGGQTFGLPGLDLAWKARRLEASDLQIRLAAAQPGMAVATIATAAITPSAAIELREVAAAVMAPPVPLPEPAMTARKRPAVRAPVAPATPPVPAAATSPPPAKEAAAAGDSGAAARAQIAVETQTRALEQARLEQERQSERARQAALLAAAQRESARQEQLRQDAARAEQTASSEAARLQGERQAIARQESLRQERATQDENARRAAARQELERIEAARLEAARQEVARQEQTRQAQLEAARHTQLEAARQDAMKQEAARRELAKQEAARQDGFAQETARQDAVKQEAARQEQARRELAQRQRTEQEASREERLRAIGKQLNAEAAQHEAASRTSSRSLLPTVSGLRRGWLLGRADANNDLVLYAEAISRKIELNQTFDMVREAVKQPHTRPMVTVAVRADGSVEKVTFDVSSGVAAIDHAIRKVVASQAPYSAFTPAIARHYDVIEIRRTWIFDTAIRLE